MPTFSIAKSLFRHLFLAYAVLGTSLPSLAAEGGNGSERGGGDRWALEFVSSGQEVAKLIDEWRVADPHVLDEVDTAKLRELLEGNDPDKASSHAVKVLSKPRVYLKTKGKMEEVDAVNDPIRRTIVLGRIRWDERAQGKNNDKRGKMSFALHEYCRFLKIPDAQYQLSGRFLSILDRHLAIQDFKREAKRHLEAIGAAMEEAIKPKHWAFSSLFETLRVGGDYRNCMDTTWESLPRNVACESVLKMFRETADSVTKQLTGMGDIRETVREREADFETYLGKVTQARADFARAAYGSLNAAFEPAATMVESRTGDKFFPSLKKHCGQFLLADRVKCGIDAAIRVFGDEIPKALNKAKVELSKKRAAASDAVDAYAEELL